MVRPCGRSDAGLECPFRLSRLCGWTRAHVFAWARCRDDHYWCRHNSSFGGGCGAGQGESLAGRLCSRRMIHTAISAPSRAAVVLPSPSEFSPSYIKLGTWCWRDAIVAGRGRKSSAPF